MCGLDTGFNVKINKMNFPVHVLHAVSYIKYSGYLFIN